MAFITQIVLEVKTYLADDGEEVVGEEAVLRIKYCKKINGEKVDHRELRCEQERVQTLEDKPSVKRDEHQQGGTLGTGSLL